MPRPPFSDPGGERVGAPIGSEDWAKRWRLEVQSIVKDLSHAPERVEGYFQLGHQHRVWTLLNRQDGTRFASFEQFCEERQPWGLGRPYAEIHPYLEALHGKKATALLTAPPIRQGERTGATSGNGCHKSVDRSTTLRRAILRAPEQVRDLFTADLIGVAEAARLGPKNPSPEQAARVVEVTQAAVAVARKVKPETPGDKRKAQREVNALVRTMLGDERDDDVEAAVRAFRRLTPRQRERFFARIDERGAS